MRITFVSQLSMENEAKVLCVGGEVDFSKRLGQVLLFIGVKMKWRSKVTFYVNRKRELFTK